MNALFSTLMGAASSALATLVSPVGRTGTGATEGSDAGTGGFSSMLTAALQGQSVAVAPTAQGADAEETLVAEVAAGDSEAMTAALEIAGVVGAEMAAAGAAIGSTMIAPARSRAAPPTADMPSGSFDGAPRIAIDAPSASLDVAARAGVDTPSASPDDASRIATDSPAAAPLLPTDFPTAAIVTTEASGTHPRATVVDPRHVQRGLGELDGEFRSRLERVIDRMREEFGHAVEVVETVRPQERQDFLFAQGRSRPGPIVTWTRSSNHTEGRAADLLIDGSYENALAFRRLARIAQEEGLRTLGARDPGHVELPGSHSARVGGAVGDAHGATAPGRVPAAHAETAAQPGVAQTAHIAQVAQVAAVAQPQVAAVAQVARVATVGGSTGSRAVPRTESAAPSLPVAEKSTQPEAVLAGAAPGREEGAATAELAAIAVRRERALGEPLAPSSEGPTRTDVQPAESRPVELASREPASPIAAPDASSARAPVAAQTREISGVVGTDAAERIARVLQIQEGAMNRPMSQVVLRIDSPDGGEDRIRVDLRGGVVGASIRTSDAGSAEQMTSRIGELQRALERQGLEAEYLQVRSTAPGAREVGETIRAALISESPGAGPSSDTGAQRERDGSPDREREGPPRERDAADPRQRSRREPKQGRDQ